jgi:hypothetical protein
MKKYLTQTRELPEAITAVTFQKHIENTRFYRVSDIKKCEHTKLVFSASYQFSHFSIIIYPDLTITRGHCRGNVSKIRVL